MSITGIVIFAKSTTRRIPSVPQQPRTVGIARMKPVGHLMRSEKPAGIPGIARVAKRYMLWTQPAPKDICIAPTKIAKRF